MTTSDCSSPNARFRLRAMALLALIGLFSMFLSPVLSVRADIVENDVVATGNGTITAGGSTTINYTLVNQNSSQNSADLNNCNTAGTGQVFYTISVPANVTANGVVGGAGVTLQFEFQGCGVPIGVTFSSSTVGSYPINGVPSGTGSLVDHADFTLTVNPAPVTNTAPTLTLPSNITAEATSASGAAVSYTATASDTQDGPLTPTCNPASGFTFPLGATEVSCSVTDSGGLKTSGMFTVTVQDTTAPVVSVPSNTTRQATGPDGKVVKYAEEDSAPTATDAVDGSIIPTCSPASGTEFPIGTTTVTCSATDDAGNTGSSTFTITVVDTEGPVVTVPSNMTVEATGASGAVVSFTASAEDAVDGEVDVNCDPASDSTFALGTTTVTCSATDTRNNPGSASFTVTVQDTTGPSLNLPSNQTVEATGASGAAVDFSATAIDLVDGSVAVTCTPSSGSTFSLGTTTVTCSAKDTENNSTQGSFTITVQDTVGPVVTVPEDDVTAEATSGTGAVVTFTASAEDAVDGTRPVTCAPVSGDTFSLGETTVNCSATDTQGNEGTASFKVVVQDTTKPVLTLPDDKIVEAAGPDGAAVTFFASAHDVVDGGVDVTCEPESGSIFALGTTTVDCSATDAHGNTAAGSFNITVEDTTAPEITVPDDITVEATGPTGATVTYSGATATDLVDGPVSVDCSPVSGSTFPLGSNTVECSATDDAGNVGNKSFLITVEDTTAPTITVPADITAEATGSDGAAVTFSVSASDLVDGSVDVNCDANSGDTFPLGVTEVSCSATDAAGNVGQASFTVTVVDTTAPDLTVPGNITWEATGATGAAVSFIASATDLVDGDVTPVCDYDSGDTFPLGTTTVTCSATDAHGNESASKSFTVTVQDTTAPTLNLPSNITAEATSAAGAAVNYTASASDLVDGSVAANCSPASGSIFALGTTTVNCSAADARGNSASGSFTVTVQDTTAPVIAQPQNIAVNPTGISGAVVNYTAPATSDAVDGAGAATCLPASGSTFAFGQTTVKCNATDAHGNKATEVTFTVTVANLARTGFYQPVDMSSSTIVWNTVKGGSTVPLKFEVFLTAGGTEVVDTAVVKSFTYSSVACGSGTGQTDEIEVLSTGGTSLRYDATGGQFIQNWKTPTGTGCYRVTLTLVDGSTIVAYFQIRK